MDAKLFLQKRFSYAAIAGIVMAFGISCNSSQTGEQQLASWSSLDGKIVVQKPEIAVNAGDTLKAEGDFKNFELNGKFYSSQDAEASMLFHSDGKSGYEILFHNGAIDGTTKTGSLSAVRNLYRSLAADSAWTDFRIAVRGKNISVAIGGTDVVCYTEPDKPFRLPEYASRLLGHGAFVLAGKKGEVRFKDLTVTALPENARNENDTLPAIDEQTDSIIRLQQRGFPVIDYHVHLKGGLTKEQAHAKSMNYGINYGIAPNAGEGGIGRMLSTDEEVYQYFDEVKPLPFLCGVQGEGRRWSTQFSPKALGIFDYLFTDAMTIMDKGERTRIYRPEEVRLDGRSKEEYMDLIVSQIEKILSYEPADIYANPTYLPEIMNADYDKYWTDERVNRMLDVMQKYHIALEINPRYKIPSFDIIRKAKARGMKFTFGTNNENADFGKLEYAIQAIYACGLTKDDIWFPSMSVRRDRVPVDYNGFKKGAAQSVK